MSTLAETYFTLRADLESLQALPLFPAHLFDLPDDGILSRLYRTSTERTETGILVELSWEPGEAFQLGLPEVVGVSVALGFDGVTTLRLRVETAENDLLFGIGGGFSISIDSTLMRPAALTDGSYEVIEGEPYRTGFTADLMISATGIWIDGMDTFYLGPFMIGESGIVVEPGEVRLALSPEAADKLVLDYASSGLDSNFRGLFIAAGRLHFPEDFPVASVAVEHAFIGTNGFSGTVSVEAGNQDIEERSGCFGLPFALTDLEVTFSQNSLTAGRVRGTLTLPFFEEPVGVILGLEIGGGFSLSLENTDENGLVEIVVDHLGALTLSSLGFSIEDGEVALLLSGTLQLTILDLDWPAIDLKELRIGTDGSVQLPDGWVDLPEPVGLDLFGFGFEITRIGFGDTDDGRRWVGFSGGVNLLPMLPSGASVEGLRVIWDPKGILDPKVTLQGVGIEFMLPNVLHIAGDVALIDEATERYFKGNAQLEIMPLGFSIDASIKIGHDLDDDYKFLYSFMDLTLPLGIPIWATGAALYGISGLYGMNVTPTAGNSDWYGWYTGPPEKFNVTHSDKWKGEEDGKAFGAGMTIGTLFDLGHVVSTKALFAMVLPGPVIILHGMANFLEKPPDVNDPTSEGVFNMLAVLDALAGNLQLNIDAGWGKPNLLDIAASAEAYFDFADPRSWHVYVGQDQPEDRRIRAEMLSLFHGDGYLMIDSSGIATGANISWGADWRFGPVKVILQAWIGGEAAITWQPPQLDGTLYLGGEFEVSVAGFGIGLEAEARLSGKAPTLYWVRGELALRVKLPTPFKDLEEDILLEWKEEKTPPSEDPFVSIGLEHPRVDETWTDLPEQYLSRTPGYYDTENGPLVPLDARVSIAFDRNMKDVTGLNFGSTQAYPGRANIGDYVFDYELQEVKLEKWSKAGGTAWIEVEDIYGSWMAVEDAEGEPASTRLQLWARSPFAFTRQTSRTYRDAFLANHLHWPCIDALPPETHCVDWEGVHDQTTYPPFFEHQGVYFTMFGADQIMAIPLDSASCGTNYALAPEDGLANVLWIVFPQPVRHVQLCIDGFFTACTAYSNGVLEEHIIFPDPGLVTFEPSPIDAIALWGPDDGKLARICYQIETEAAAYDAVQEHLDRVVAGMTTWDSNDEILEPETWYRLTVQEETVRTHNGETSRTPFTHYAYFQTTGPPGLTEGAIPASDPDLNTTPAYPSGGKLTDLETYIEWTIPADGAGPIYRAYDLGADFNENYIEQMYGADMAIRLLDGNEQPATDAEGNEIIFPNLWANQPVATLDETEYPYTTRVEDCVDVPGVYYLPDQKILFANGVLLDEDFSGDLDQWTDPNSENEGAWIIHQSMLYIDGAVIPPLGALLLAGEDAWKDYAIEVTLTDQGDDVGLACRYANDGTEVYYRLRFNAFGRFFTRVEAGTSLVLWEDDTPYLPGEAQTISLQCQGARIRGQVDEELLFDLEDPDGPDHGAVGIFANTTASFDRFLVRTWPGAPLDTQTMYRAELIASYPLFSGGLSDGWIDADFAWTELTKNDARLAAIGRPDWDDYRLEINMGAVGSHIGALVRFQLLADGTFTCYRLLINSDDQIVRLARLAGTYIGDTYELPESGRTELWSCEGLCDIDFLADTHDVAITCEGATLIVEIDGYEVARVLDENGPTGGQAGLYFLGDEDPAFSELVVRSAPRQPVHSWHFVTSRYAGFVEHLDSFAGAVYSELRDTLEEQQLADAIAAADAGLSTTRSLVDAARTALQMASPDELIAQRIATQEAIAAWHAEAVLHYDVLHGVLLDGVHRPLPPVIELTSIEYEGRRLALLLESPEPFDWSRIGIGLFHHQVDRYELMGDVLLVWSHDGTRAFLIDTAADMLPDGLYRLQFTCHLDIGLEAPLLRRSGSTLPEIALLSFELT